MNNLLNCPQGNSAHLCIRPACTASCSDCNEAISPSKAREYAVLYAFLRNRDLDSIDKGGVFAGLTPDNRVLNGDDLDEVIREYMAKELPQRSEEQEKLMNENIVDRARRLGLHNSTLSQIFDRIEELESRLAQGNAGDQQSKEAETVELPFAILPDELKALERFHECALDGEDYDVPKQMMRRLSEIGFVRSIGFGRYEHTEFGLSFLHGEFASPSTTQPDMKPIPMQPPCTNEFVADGCERFPEE